MKKFYSIVFLACIMIFLLGKFALADTVIRYRLEPSGTLTNEYSAIHSTHNFSAQFVQDVAPTFSIAGEFIQNTQKELLFGGGIEYQPTRRIEGESNGFNFIPVYFLVRTNTNNNTKKAKPFLTGRVGYNFYQEENPADGFKLHGGLYYGFGAGIAFQRNLQFELSYARNNGEAESDDLNLAIKHSFSEIGVSFGYRF